MSCSDFISRFSDYFDGVGDAGFLAEAEAHLASCCSCRRYSEVVERGSALVRSTPSPVLSRDFYPRLRHRLFHLEDAQALSRSSSGSSTTAATVLGMAVLLTAVAWSPLVRSGEPEVVLAPIVVDGPGPSRAIGLRPKPVSLSASFASTSPRFGPSSRDLRDHSQSLLWASSPLFESYGSARGLRRASQD